MSTLFPKTISYISHTANGTSGSYVNGVWVPGTSETLTFTGSVQPLSGKEIESLPEARRDKGTVKVYSSTQLAVSKQNGTTTGDIVIWQNRKWEIIQEMENQNSLIPHYKYIAQYVGEVEA